MKPLIGITTGEIVNITEPWSPITYGQSHTYSDAVIRAGGVPLLIPITEDFEALKQMYDLLDGLLFAGGNDINPQIYGQAIRPETKDVSDKRDTAEIALMHWALADHMPILAICRGAQLLNAFSGGTLHQHTISDVPGAQDHTLSSQKEDATYIAHNLKVEMSSRLASIIANPTITANSHHHQSIDKIAPTLTATAWAEDGIVEVIEGKGAQFIIGIECHPESLFDVEPKWELVFKSFIDSSLPLTVRLHQQGTAETKQPSFL